MENKRIQLREERKTQQRLFEAKLNKNHSPIDAEIRKMSELNARIADLKIEQITVEEKMAATKEKIYACVEKEAE